MTNNNWHRLAPVALLFYFFRTLKQIGSQGTQALAPLAVVVFSSDNKLLAIVSSLGAFAAVIFIAALLQYWFFRYCIFDDELQMKYGVFKKQHRIIQFKRVQNVNIKLPFYFKPFKLVVLALDTAGSNDDEANLAGISKHNAEQLRDTILSHKNEAKNQTDSQLSANKIARSPNTTSDNGRVIASANIKELAYFGFTNNQTLFLAAVLAPFIDKFQEQNQWLSIKPVITQLSEHIGQVPATMVVVLSSVLIVFSVVQLISIISAIVIHYKFNLTLFGHQQDSPQEKKLICQGGLLSQYQKALDLSKVQQIRQRASWQARLLKVENLICHQIGSKKASENLTIPARTNIQSQALLKHLLPNAPLNPPQQTISKHFFINKALRFVFIPCSLIFAFLLSNQPPTLAGFTFALIPVILLPFMYMYWRKFRFDFYIQNDYSNSPNDDSAERIKTDNLNSYAVIHQSFIGYTRIYIPLHKVQNVQIQQTITQKRRHLANLKLYLATGSYTIPFIPLSLAQMWFERINYIVHTSKRPWY